MNALLAVLALLSMALVPNGGSVRSAADSPVVYQVGAGQAEVTPTDWQSRIYWIAGYDAFRAATSVNDPLMARALVVDDGLSPMAIVTYDLLGITSDDADFIRDAIVATVPELEHRVLVHATHQHEGPDTIGIWGGAGFPFANPRPFDYIEYLAQQGAAAVQAAWNSRQPVHTTFASIAHDPLLGDLVRDSRDPQVHDPQARLLIFHNGGGNVATLVNWASHPEVLGSDNQAMTADYVKWVVDEIEETFGGAGIFVNGAVGGLLSSDGSQVLPNYPRHTFEKAEAVGRTLATRLMQRVQDPQPGDVVETYEALPPIVYQTRAFYLPVENPLLVLAQLLNRVPKQAFRQFEIPQEEWRRLRSNARYTNTSATFVQIGPAGILTAGGELYPELLVGGIEPLGIPPFSQFPPEAPLVENPNFAPLTFKFFFGLTNDFIGYIIPVSEWDGIFGGEYGEDFGLSYDEGTILSENLHLLMLGYETGEYPDPDELPAFLGRRVTSRNGQLAPGAGERAASGEDVSPEPDRLNFLRLQELLRQLAPQR